MSVDHGAVTPKAMRRAELADATGCNIETIRYYETTGILPEPDRSRAGHRIYGTPDVKRLRFVLRARELGFSVEDVRGLLGLGDGAAQTCADVRHMTETHLADVRAKIADLQRIEAVLTTTSARCSGFNVPECAVLEALERA